MKNKERISVFNYMSFRRFLVDYYAEQKKLDKRFSYRAFSALVGTHSTGFYRDLVTGRRNLGGGFVIRFARAMKLNPKVRVVLIDDASLLDRDHFAVVKDMAKDHGFQVWCGIIGNPDGADVVFEQGVAVAGSAVVA